MATTYLNGQTSQNVTGNTVLGIDIPLGRRDTGSRFAAVVPTVLGVDIPLGNRNPQPNPGLASDRAPNVPSGMTVNGVPTYGDGKRNVNTTFDPDYSYASTNAKFVYLSGSTPTSKKFSELT